MLGVCCDNPCGSALCGAVTLDVCDDNNPCTVNDSCANGSCEGTPVRGTCGAGLVCNDGACVSGCWIDGGVVDAGARVGCRVCDPAQAPLAWSVAVNEPCDDNNACTGLDTCQFNGLCVSNEVRVCLDSDPCRDVAVCEPTTGLCGVGPALPDGTRCAPSGAYCVSGQCFAGCATDAGVVPDGTRNPANPCEVCDSLNDDSAWLNAPEDTSCGVDGGCVLAACHSGACVPVGTAECPAIDQCHLAGSCDIELNRCSAPLAANGASCDAGVACSTADTCEAGVCTPELTACACNDDVDCLPAPTCREPKCRSHTCTFDVVDDGVSCDDGDACTSGEQCVSGTCTGGQQPVCPQATACSASACDPSLGACTSKPTREGLPCDGGLCVAGHCKGAEGVDGGTVTPELGAVEFTTCGCGAGGGGFSVLALALLALRRRRPF